MNHTSNLNEIFGVLSKVAAEYAHGIIITNAEGEIEWVNSSFIKSTGYTLEEIIGKKPGSFLQGPDTDPETVAYMRERLEKGEPFVVEILNYTKTKKPLWIRLQCQAIRNDDGEIIKYFAVEEDISQYKKNIDLLKEFENKMRLALEKIGDYVWEHDFRTGKTRFSKKENHFLGITIDENTDIDKEWWQHIHPDDRPMLEAGDKRCRNGEVSDHAYEYRMIDNKGEIHWVLDRGVVIEKDEKGLPLLMLGTHTDITKRKKTEHELEIQRRFYEDILNNVPADIAVFDKEHRYLFVNPRGIKDKNLREWIIGKKDEDYLRLIQKPIDSLKHRSLYFNQVIQTREQITWEEINTQPDGTNTYVLRHLYPVLDQQNEIKLVIGYGVDITDRKKSELALKDNEERYRSIIANMNLGLLEIDKEGNVIFANKSIIEMVGIDPDKATGINVTSFLPKESLSLLQNHGKDKLNHKNIAFELKVNVKNECRWWLISSAPRFNESGEFTGTIVICLDINEQKQMEAELRAAHEKAEQLAKAKQNFLANMSHEIRTPMNAILGMSNQLAKTQLDETQQFYLKTINTAAENLLVIINDILDLSKIEAGKFRLEEIGFEPQVVFSNTIKMFLHKAEEKGIQLTHSYCDEKVAKVLIGDPVRLQQVLLNLVSNAVKFTDSGFVDIRCEVIEDMPEEQKIKIIVADTGKGMDKSFLDQLFDKFTQEYDTANRKHQGSGLGMSITKELVELMGGKIYVYSEKRKGTTVILEIPFKKGTFEHLPQEEVNVFAGDFLKNKKILVADDNEMNRLIASIILENYGATIIEAVNGDEAVKQTMEHQPDIILMDIQMPILNGYEATTEIRARHFENPIIAVTANAIKGEQEKCIAAGMNDYISKPFKEEELLKIISHWIKNERQVNIHKHPEVATAIIPTNGYDLTQLKSIAKGNEQFVRQMLEVFIHQGPETVKLIKQSYENNEMEQVKKLAHKLKPSIDMMGIQAITGDIRTIESKALEMGKHADLWALIEKVDTVIADVVDQLKLYMKSESKV